jgi:hypothetical protein
MLAVALCHEAQPLRPVFVDRNGIVGARGLSSRTIQYVDCITSGGAIFKAVAIETGKKV